MTRTATSIGVVSLAAFLQIVIQFLIQRVMAGVFGAGAQADALAAALALPTVLTAIITGSLSYGLIPEMVRSMQSNAAQRTASFVGLCTLAISGLTSAMLYYLAANICSWLYGDLPTQQLELVVDLLRILSPQVLLGGLISWLMAVHHSRQKFLWPALGGVLGTGLTLLLATRTEPDRIATLAWAINAGSLASVVVQMLPIMSWLRAPEIDRAAAGRLGGILLPLLLGAAILRLDPLVDRILASRLPDEGTIAYIHYSQRILAALLAIGTSSLSLVAFPQLAEELAGKGEKGFAVHFAIAFRRLLLIIVPVTLGVGCFAVWIIRDLLEHRAFTPVDSQMVGWLTILHLGMFAGASCAELLARGFYVLGDSRTPTAIGVAALLVSWIAKWALFVWIGVWGIALGVSIYCLLSAGGMAWWLTRRCGRGIWADVGQALGQAVLASWIACGLSWMAYQVVPHGTWLAAILGAAGYFVTLTGLKNKDATAIRELLTQRMLGQ